MSTAATSRLGWYARRAARMSPAEMAWRVRDQLVRAAWSPRQVTREQLARVAPAAPARELAFTAVLPPGTAARVPEEARKPVLEAADRLLRGEWETLGVLRTDLERPDWFRDPVTGRRSDPDRYAFRVDHRSEEQTGNVKQVWEIARLQHLTLLASAWALSHDERYAQRVDEQLRSFWQENPFLSGIHWTSGIEVGIRLISLAWIRRLLDDWPGVTGPVRAQRPGRPADQVAPAVPGRLPQPRILGQQPRDRRGGRPAGGQLRLPLVPAQRPVAARVRAAAGARAAAQHVPVRRQPRAGFGLPAVRGRARLPGRGRGRGERTPAEPAGVAAADRDGGQRRGPAGRADAAAAPGRLRRGPGAAARPARGRTPGRALLALAGALVGPLDWWPRPPADAGSVMVGALRRRQAPGRGQARPAAVAVRRRGSDAAARPAGENEIWCRCDGGPHGYLSIAAHAHADALSVEVRYAGMDILADPGTYCYHGERAWRSYFRSTIAHNTAELGGRNQSSERWPVHVGASCASPRDRGHRRRRHRPVDRGASTATPRSTRRPRIAARYCWTGPRAASTSSTRSRAAATTSAWPSISVPRSRWSSTGHVPP